jgi:hypothetical protein
MNSGALRVNLVTNPVISREWGKDREEFTTNGTYPWSFVTHIFHNGQPSHGGNLLLYITPVSPANQNHTIIIKGLKANISIFIYQMNFND